MSQLPSRTRSLRKPAGNVGRKNERLIDSPTTRTAEPNQSPSRLPTASSRPPSAGSNASPIRPPPSRANIGRPTTAGGSQLSSSIRISHHASSTATEPVKQDRSRPPLTQSRHLRNASTSLASATPTTRAASNHTRAKSFSTLLTPSTNLRPPMRERTRPPTREEQQAARPAPASTQQAEPQPQQQHQPKRPAFSTLQQHFSPLKNPAPKPHPATFLAPPSPSKLPSNIAISTETSRLQNELLQLHILHRDAARVASEWRASAKRKLGDRFGRLVVRSVEVGRSEVVEMGWVNAGALAGWRDGEGVVGWGFEEKIRVLDEVVNGVWNLGDAGGKYVRVVRKFERWLARYQDILEARSHDATTDDNNDVLFLEPLDPAWKDDCLLLARKLATWKDQLKNLSIPEPDPASSLTTVLEGCRRLVGGMAMELAVMGRIEKDAVVLEGEWVRGMNDDDTTDDEDMPVAGAVWRSC